jgi:hypothetical protein
MKKGWWILIIVLGSFSKLHAQLEAPEKPVGFDNARVFIGTSLNLGLSNRFFNLGLNPELGYSLKQLAGHRRGNEFELLFTKRNRIQYNQVQKLQLRRGCIFKGVANQFFTLANTTRIQLD